MHDAVRFERSSYCANSCCVEVAVVSRAGIVLVRSSQVPDAQITFSAEEWRAFLAGVKNGEFEV
ncbi:hypothetical protein QFZ60_000744 [Arthrobacter sp. B2I5]|uniref:DUF397 domain-containing protein n=1 Tax=Arthrobacter sp. B2I5 TaxID=3042266 RepID=UPI0027867519|nr:DUF397 domain-containing protein [Arthrobacter sp. B2I5]MDQ0824571.1 hypothetical protein [Arthrobacter sp. B2I5]